MATEIRLTKEDIKLAIELGVSAFDSESGNTYYNLPDWFALGKNDKYARILSVNHLPKWVKEFAQTTEETHKDQQIKDLEDMVREAESCMEYASKKLIDAKHAYQQKYPKP